MEEEKQMPEGVLICLNRKLENGSGEVKCVGVDTFERFLNTQNKTTKCKV